MKKGAGAMNSGIDGHHERIKISFRYASIEDYIKTLKDAQKRIKKLKATGGLNESKGTGRGNVERRHGKDDD
jgi:hypothetical protein